jgi:hypothetical protein
LQFSIIASIIAMLVLGLILLFVFAVWDFGYATRPVIPPRFIKNRTIVIAASVGFIDFVSGSRSSCLVLRVGQFD